MLKEILDANYQNFYVNEDGMICGIVTPTRIWKIQKPKMLLEKYQKSIKNLNRLGNFAPAQTKLKQLKKNIKQLKNAMLKQNGIIGERV